MNELTDWSVFRARIANLYNDGASEEQISMLFAGELVNWIGEVGSINLDRQYAKGISMNMGAKQLPLVGDKVLRSNHLVLSVDEHDTEAWRRCSPGDKVHFEAVINGGAGPFLPISFNEADDDPEVTLMMGLSTARLLKLANQSGIITT